MSESQLIEYKESWRDIQYNSASFGKPKLGKQYAKRIATICGFANAQGGVLYIGMRDDGTMLKREAVFNALIHQDFSVGVPVQISVYKDKLYISNDCVFPEDWTAETLMQKHRSLPHNPDIANTFFRAGFIESWGRGIEKICMLCADYGIPKPEYTVHCNDIMMRFKSNKIANVQEKFTENENVQENVQEKDRTKIILGLLRTNNQISIRELAEQLQVTTKTIQRDLDKLKSQNIIRRIGADKGGYWQIITSGESESNAK